MKKMVVRVGILVMAVAAMVGCASGPKNLDGFEKDLGVVMPFMMFGDKTEGEHDSEAYLFTSPKSIASDKEGNIYVGGKSFVLTKYTSDGEFVKVLAERGDNEGQINYVKGIACNSAGEVYAVDSINKKVNVFDADGNWMRKFGEEGEGPGMFMDMGPIAIDSEDNVYVSDDVNGIVVFDKDDKYIKNIGNKGEGAGQTSEFGWVAVDSKTRQLYIAVDGSGRVDAYDIDTGEYKFDFGGLGEGPGMWLKILKVLLSDPGDSSLLLMKREEILKRLNLMVLL